MRIVELRFENLNSLVGRWQIDLEQAEFVSDGIFAITGPTGAGKTTILDAICLALYGSTPRLGRLSKGTNELMSRQCGECFAEVTFETRTGRYTSHWSQHRARKKAGGDLQAPQHEISAVVDGKILSSSLKESAALIVELTGMSFEQFTRSMLLAQGSFAAFLQAKSDDRAPILEQITGSEIYSEISVLVHQCRGEQEQRLQALQQQLEGRPVLSVEQRSELQQQFATLQQQAQTLQTEQQHSRSMLQVLRQLETNALRQQQHAQKQYAHQQRSAAFDADRQRLTLARRTLEIAPDYRALAVARQEQESDQVRLLDYQQQQPASLEQLTLMQQALKLQEGQWQQQRAEFERMQPILEQVREWDAQISQWHHSFKMQQVSDDETAASQQRLKAHAEQLAQQRDLVITGLTEVQKKIDRSGADATLPEALSGLLQGLEAWMEVDQRIATSMQLIQEHGVNLDQTQRGANALKAQCQSAEQHQQQCQALVQQCQQALDTCLSDRPLTAWQYDYRERLERKQRCQQAIENWRQMTGLTEALAADQQGLSVLQHRIRQLDLTIAQLQHELALQHVQMEGLQQQEILQRRIETYEQARVHLHAGQPCPLCGALEHPFAQGVQGVMTHLQEQIHASQQEKTRLERALSVQQVEHGNASFQQDELQKRLLSQHAALQVCQSEQPALLDALDIVLIPVNQTIGSVLAQLQVELDLQIQQLGERLELASQRSTALQQALQTLQQSAQTVQRQQNQWHEAQQKYDVLWQQVSQMQRLGSELSEQQAALVEKLRHQLSVFGVSASVFTQRAQVQNVKTTLIRRRDQWLHLQAELHAAQQNLPKLEQSIQHVQEQLQTKTAELQRLRLAQDQLQQQIQHLDQQRQTLLPLENPVDVGRRLSAAIEQTRVALDQARERLAQVQMAHQQLLDRQLTLRAALARREQQIKAQQSTLTAWLGRHGFASEQAFQSAMLSDAQRQSLENQERELLNEKSALEAAHVTLLSEQKHLSASVATSQPAEVLEQHLLQTEQRYQATTETLGGLRQRLADDDRTKQESEKLLSHVQLQQAEFDRWNMLHSLIGSADGKKFRTFAQGLTFEVVIQHANRQLQRMTDRYVLVRGASEPLELNVIDQYQAAEVRTTKNLSGGESFLVSLALALGLSNMASRKVRVDSLFLDEGFGTLDEDALELALQTLSTLHQEGKLIGVISHVQALKERIATQIQVLPVRGGRSVLQGPGCTKLTHDNTA